MSASTRLFFALWPDETVRSEIATAVSNLEINGRVTAPNNLHLTLVFLGAVDPARRACIEQAAGTIDADPIEFALSQVQARRNGGIVWLTTPETPAPLTRLVMSLQVALEACGYEAERRVYRPHVTVVRNARRPGGERTISAITWRALEFCLMSSTPSSRGSNYAIVRRWSLLRDAAPS